MGLVSFQFYRMFPEGTRDVGLEERREFVGQNDRLTYFLCLWFSVSLHNSLTCLHVVMACPNPKPPKLTFPFLACYGYEYTGILEVPVLHEYTNNLTLVESLVHYHDSFMVENILCNLTSFATIDSTSQRPHNTYVMRSGIIIF